MYGVYGPNDTQDDVIILGTLLYKLLPKRLNKKRPLFIVSISKVPRFLRFLGGVCNLDHFNISSRHSRVLI